MTSLKMSTPCGEIRLVFRPDAAPVTVAYVKKVVADKLYDGTSFYRSDFVIQCGKMLCLCCSIGQSPDATSAAFGLKCAHTHTRVFSLSLSLSRSDAQRTRTHTTPCTRLTQTRNAHAHAHAHCPLHKAHSDSQRTRTHTTPCTRLARYGQDEPSRQHPGK
jgi:hypothetical protein